jgi:uncharacterized protein
MSTEVAKLPTDTAYKAALFIETYTGRAFYPLDPVADALSIIDIAHAIANQCRYSVHTAFHYSIAQHCCLLAAWLAENGGSALDCLQLLMHDAAEAYLVDVPRPVKQFMPEYRVWDAKVNDCIRKWMGWSDIPIPAFQDELDSRIIVDERAALMDKARRNDWGHKLAPVGVQINPWTPVQAEKQFLMQYAAYSHEVYGSHQYINEEWKINAVVSHIPTASDMRTTLDVVEVDFRGNVARIKLRDEEGILQRDTLGGVFPRPLCEWHHGKYEITERK